MALPMEEPRVHPLPFSNCSSRKLALGLAARQNASKTSISSASSRSSRSTSNSVLNRDIIYRAMNDFQLSGSMLSAYTDLLGRLGFDLNPLSSQGQTWILCRGKADDQSPCRRMVPEMYLQAAVGKILKAASKTQLTGDNLVEVLATAYSYAICSQHHRVIHKVVRALEARDVVEVWRSERSLSEVNNSPSRKDKSEDTSNLLLAKSAKGSDTEPERDPGPKEATQDIQDDKDDPLAAYTAAERLKVERQLQEYLRNSSRGRGNGSDGSSRSSSKRSETFRKQLQGLET